jgi:hypothetical protein
MLSRKLTCDSRPYRIGTKHYNLKKYGLIFFTFTG